MTLRMKATAFLVLEDRATVSVCSVDHIREAILPYAGYSDFRVESDLAAT